MPSALLKTHLRTYLRCTHIQMCMPLSSHDNVNTDSHAAHLRSHSVSRQKKQKNKTQIALK